MGFRQLIIKLALGTQKVSSFLNHVRTNSSLRTMRGAGAGSLTSFFSTSSFVGTNRFLWGRWRAAIRSLTVVAAAASHSFMRSSGIFSTLYSVPYHFSFLSQVPGTSRETTVMRQLSGRRQSSPCLIRPGLKVRSLLLPLISHSLGSGFCMTALVLLVKRAAGAFSLNLKSTSAMPFCSSKIHCSGSVSRSRAMYWKMTLMTSR